MHNAPTPW